MPAQALTAPVTCLFAGRASAFPYYAYYALCLLRLGVDYLPCDGGALAGGALADANLLVLPGGFATWGIDRAEDAPGADAEVRDLLGRRGRGYRVVRWRVLPVDGPPGLDRHRRRKTSLLA